MADKGTTDTASPSKGKVLVSISKETAETLDNIGLNLAAAVEEQVGLRPEFTRAQIVQAIASDAQRRQDAAWDAAHASADDEDTAGVGGSE